MNGTLHFRSLRPLSHRLLVYKLTSDRGSNQSRKRCIEVLVFYDPLYKGPGLHVVCFSYPEQASDHFLN